jgi:predicted DCC family thiol-disulfide oxidoreductase YuxK
MKPQPCFFPLRPDERLLVFDGVCRLCSGWARFVLRYDHGHKITLTTVQSETGQKILTELGLDTISPESIVFIENGTAWFESDAIFRIIGHLSPVWRVLRVFRIVPRSVRDWVYTKIARNRYRLFGRRDICFVPTPEHSTRFRD